MKTLNDFYRLFPSNPANRPDPTLTTRVLPAVTALPTPANDPLVLPAPGRYRQRDYGTGYGRSSGYAQDRSYTEGRGDRTLRVG